MRSAAMPDLRHWLVTRARFPTGTTQLITGFSPGCAREFPAVMFQLCASGGGRVDYGAMRYHEEFWPSDKTNGIARIPIQWGYSHFFPANAMASHIGRHGEGDFKLRVDIAMTGRLGVELSPDAVSAADREVIKPRYRRLQGPAADPAL